ncbi:uncharacterized protein LOC119596733 [Penaeus monodon]|uniref:uncharacterized protein LOC119596733 n=1 Tax=Penaeus monodon TaxID=6687 RepID=UPI0018A79E93|nr:uncharacterized protein LOC119596733 [Penaeus monodon]
MGGRTTTVMYSVLGVSLYIVTVVVWAARCGAVLSVILRLFAKKKVESSSSKGRPSPYHSMSERRPVPAHHSLRGLVTLIFLLLAYVLSAGVHLVGGRDYWCGLENLPCPVTFKPHQHHSDHTTPFKPPAPVSLAPLSPPFNFRGKRKFLVSLIREGVLFLRGYPGYQQGF